MASTLRFNKLKIFFLLTILIFSCAKDKNPQTDIKLDKIKHIIDDTWIRDTNKETTFKQVMKIDGDTFTNQYLYFDKKNNIDSTRSKFFILEIKDTLKKGPNSGHAFIHTFNYPKEHIKSRLSCVIINNTYPNGETVKDTFCDKTSIVQFGIYATNQGNLKIEGEIYEEYQLVDDFKDLYFFEVKSYFKKYSVVPE